MADFDRQYWKIKDFAEHFGLDKSTVYNKIERGEIRAIRIGKTALRIPRLPDAKARRQAIEKASSQVRSGGAFTVQAAVTPLGPPRFAATSQGRSCGASSEKRDHYLLRR